MASSSFRVATYLFFLLFASVLLAQDYSLYQEETLVVGQDSLPFRILPPKDLQPDKKYPLILFLHGSGERGSDNKLQLTHGADLFLRDDIRNDFPAYVVFPQCREGTKWNNSVWEPGPEARQYTFPEEIEYNLYQNLLQSMLVLLESVLPLDPGRMYVGGLSMGGMGTFEIVQRNPEKFAAAFAICGGANPLTANRLGGPAWWIFHGDSDKVVPSIHSEEMVEAMKNLGFEVRFTLYQGVNHDSWTQAFSEPDLLPWLFSHKK